MKRRKRMGMYKAATMSSRSTEATEHSHDFVETPAVQIHAPMQSAFESTPEKFVAFVNRMTEAPLASRQRAKGLS